MEDETSFMNANPDEAGAVSNDVTTEDAISRGRPSRKIRAGNTLNRSLRRRRPTVAPLPTDNSDLFSNTYGTFSNDESGMTRLSSSGEDHVMTIEAHHIDQHRSFGERTKMKWSRCKENVAEKFEFFSVSRAMECYGGGAFSYFKFVVWLGRANFFTMVLYIGALLLPFIIVNPEENFFDTIKGTNQSNYKFVNNCSHQYDYLIENYTQGRTTVLEIAFDILQGTGVVEKADYLYIGRYFDKVLYNVESLEVQYNTSLAFYLSLWATLLVLLLVTVISSGSRTVKRINVHTEEATYTFKTLARWDFMMRDRRRVKVERRSITMQLKMELDEDKRRLNKERMSRGRRNTIICKRILAWIIYLLLTGGSLVGVYFVIDFSSRETVNQENAVILFLLQYLPSIYIVAINFIIQLYCTAVVSCEEYSANIAISITIKRTVLLRFVALFVLVSSMFITLNDCHGEAKVGDKCVKENCETVACWETYVGQQIYRLFLLDFIVFLGMCVGDLIRKFFCGCIKYDVSTVFDIPKNVIDLIYTQTLTWMGMFFCPLLPVAMFIKIVINYFFKKMCVVFHIYRQDERVFNAAQTDSYFLDTLLITLIGVVILPLGIGTSLFVPSRSCSPFRLYFAPEGATIQGAYIALDSAITQAFQRIGKTGEEIFNVIISYMVLIPLWIVLALVIYYFVTLSTARKNLNRHLQLQMISEMQDQAFHQKRALESLKALKIAQKAQDL